MHDLLHDPLGAPHLPQQRLDQVASMYTALLPVLPVYLDLAPHLMEVVPDHHVHLHILWLPRAVRVHRADEVAIGCIHFKWNPESIVISFV